MGGEGGGGYLAALPLRHSESRCRCCKLIIFCGRIDIPRDLHLTESVGCLQTLLRRRSPGPSGGHPKLRARPSPDAVSRPHLQCKPDEGEDAVDGGSAPLVLAERVLTPEGRKRTGVG